MVIDPSKMTDAELVAHLAKYHAARKKQLLKAGFGIWVYRSGSEHDDCFADHIHLNGLCASPDHSFWKTYYPTGKLDCGCYVTGAHNIKFAMLVGGEPEKPLPSLAS